MSSNTLSSFWKEQASATRPGNSSSTSPRTCSGDHDSRSAGRCRLAGKRYLHQGVAAQSEAQRLERAVGDLDVREAVLVEPRLELVDLVASVDSLEQRAATDDRRVEVAVERDLLLEIVRDVARAPPELDDVDELAADVEHPFDVA